MQIKNLKKLHADIKSRVVRRLEDFIQKGRDIDDKEIFAELTFCILTPQSSALRCWDAVCELKSSHMLFKGNTLQLKKVLSKKTRFHNKKSEYIVHARQQFLTDEKLCIRKKLFDPRSSFEKREWIEKNIKGIGIKEASHFLRNIGLGEDLAILDRHVLKNLLEFKIIFEYPESLSSKKYVEIEKKMQKFSKKVQIPMDHLDFVFFYKETGLVFK